MKEKVIVFGAGKLYKERIAFIEEKNEIVAIVDNMADRLDKSAYSYPLYIPEKIIELENMPIILLSDAAVDIILQICNLIGIEECKKRVKIGRLYVPVTGEEKEISAKKMDINVVENKVFMVNSDGEEVLLQKEEFYIKTLYRIVSQRRDSVLQELIKMSAQPIDELFGRRRGKPVDRYYIENFLDNKKAYIRGKCLEIAENTYTKEFGQDRVAESKMLHVEGWGEGVVKGNLETGEGIEANYYDSMIITQTLMFIYDVKSVVENIYMGLKENGTALITVSGISKIARYDDDNWGMFHSFYMSGLKKLFYPIFGEENIEIIHYGNVKTAMAFLYGATVEELTREDFDLKDIDYPVIYGIVAKKERIYRHG